MSTAPTCQCTAFAFCRESILQPVPDYTHLLLQEASLFPILDPQSDQIRINGFTPSNRRRDL